MKKASKVAVGSVDVVPVEGRRAVRGEAVEKRRMRAATAAAHAQAAWQSWYVLMVASGRELDVQRALADRLGAVSMVPIGVRWQRVAAHVQARIGAARQRREFVLLDGYVFVEGYRPSMLDLPHVFGFVGVGAPECVSPRVLAAFASASGRYGSHDETRDDPVDPARAAYDALANQVGRMVSVMDGPFRGQVGLLRAVRHAGVARIEMRAMGRAVGVDVPIGAVDAVGVAS